MSGLNNKDVQILRYYAENGNRELYWNYLAQKPGNDGYGLLALGVVRNDNVPGQVANSYAQSAAHATRPNMSERDWENFGIDLMRRDLAERQEAMRKGEPVRALNLSAVDVTRVHDQAFEHAGIAKEAWTPRKLMEMAERKSGPAGMQEIWTGMLDNQKLGLYRGVSTLDEVRAHTDFRSMGSIGASAQYVGEMAAARMAANSALPNTNPNIIGSLNHNYVYSARENSWSEILQRSGASVPLPPRITTVTDERLIDRLNDTRALRLDRLASRDERHPDDPTRTIARSPITLAEANGSEQDANIRLASDTGPSWVPLSQNIQRALAEKLPEGAVVSDDRIAQFTAAARNARIGAQEKIELNLASDVVTIRGSHPAHVAQVDLTRPLPTAEESLTAFKMAEHAQIALSQVHLEQSQQQQRGFERG